VAADNRKERLPAPLDTVLEDAVEILPEGGLSSRLEQAAREGRQLRLKLGIDPTAPVVHLGHAVLLRRLRAFQDAGHRVVLIIGDFTARIGDPSGRSQLRPLLDARTVAQNAAGYLEQATLILRDDPDHLEVRHNSEWLEMEAGELLSLLRLATVAQLLEREDFANRLAAGKPLSLLELVYPLLQAYDSVAVRADVEFGGTDQKFNLLLGREIQRAYGQPEQVIVTLPILTGTDGQRKMSKTFGNEIGLSEPPEEIYGKTMSIPDGLMEEYYRLLLGEDPPPLRPRDQKHELAYRIVAWLHGSEAAERAREHFERVVVRKEVPDEVPEAVVGAGTVNVPALLSEALGLSRSEVRRLIDQGGVAVDGRVLPPNCYELPSRELVDRTVRVGKRRFLRLRKAA